MKALPELEQINKFEFKNSDLIPFVSLNLLNAKDINAWSSNDRGLKTNLIHIVCAKGIELDFDIFKQVFIKIAAFLNWQLIDEQTDDEVANFIIWSPDNRP